MDYKEALEYINGAKWFGAEATLDRMYELMGKLGNVHSSLRFVHIAGTNGKGSCAAMTASVLRRCGYKTGLFTSPYLARFSERMRINGEEIEDEVLADIVSRVKNAAETMEEHPTEFELMTAVAFIWFAESKCDIVVLEVGLGGRFDATNIISAPEACVIMNIGLDHTAILGDTVEKIAFEKAGIIKQGCPCVVYGQSPSVIDVIRTRCRELDSPLVIADFDEIVTEFDSPDGQVFTYRGTPCAIPLLGAHQRKNAAVVLELVEVLRTLGWKLSEGDVEHGLYSAAWPGRFEILSDSPYFVVDGGHNPQCAQTVAENLDSYFPGMKHVLMIGVLRDKDYTALCDILAPTADEFVCITPDSPRALPAFELAEYLEKFGKPVTVCDTVRDGVAAAVDAAEELEGVACAVGSLYTVGEIRAFFGLK